jgi:NTE family protein
VISFDKGKEIIRKGEEATFAVYEQLKNSRQVYSIQKPKLILQSDSLQIREINSNELDNYTKEYVIGKLKFKPGTKTCYDDLIKGINNINATQNFSSISYSLDKNKNEDNLNYTKKMPQKTYLKLGSL